MVEITVGMTSAGTVQASTGAVVLRAAASAGVAEPDGAAGTMEAHAPISDALAVQECAPVVLAVAQAVDTAAVALAVVGPAAAVIITANRGH